MILISKKRVRTIVACGTLCEKLQLFGFVLNNIRRNAQIIIFFFLKYLPDRQFFPFLLSPFILHFCLCVRVKPFSPHRFLAPQESTFFQSEIIFYFKPFPFSLFVSFRCIHVVAIATTLSCLS